MARHQVDARSILRGGTVRCMHRSRVYAPLIDTPEAEAAPAAAFWSAALGATARPVPEEPQFTLQAPGNCRAVSTPGSIVVPARQHEVSR